MRGLSAILPPLSAYLQIRVSAIVLINLKVETGTTHRQSLSNIESLESDHAYRRILQR